MLTCECHGYLMGRKEREENPRWRGQGDRKDREKQPAVAGAMHTVTPGRHNWRVQGIQTFGNGTPRAQIGTHGHGANPFIGICGSRAMHGFVWNSRWWGELFLQLIQEQTTTVVVETVSRASRLDRAVGTHSRCVYPVCCLSVVDVWPRPFSLPTGLVWGESWRDGRIVP